MGVYIKGMEMPTSCDGCWALDDNGDYPRCRITDEQRGYNFPVREKRMDKCPLVPVPEHGRLGDLDVLAGQMQRNLFEIEDKAERELGFDETLRRGMQYGHAVCVDAVNDAPTIIPADKEGE